MAETPLDEDAACDRQKVKGMRLDEGTHYGENDVGQISNGSPW